MAEALPLLPQLRKWRLLVFASGDFAFNLYWQSIMLYLLFYYTEELHLTIKLASLGYAIASVWDGIASLLVGLLADRFARPERFSRILIIGAVPLGLSFALCYAALPRGIDWQFGWILATHLAFRTIYALVNIPYLAMSARITLDSDERALVAGARMLFGTIAAVIVALATVPLGRWLGGGADSDAFATSAMAFAAIGSLMLVLVGLTYRDDKELAQVQPIVPQPGALGPAFRNRAFLALSAAMTAMIIAVTVLDKSVLYYFKYALQDESAGRLTLGWMMAVSGIAIPVWLVIARRMGSRNVWFTAIAISLLCLALFILLALDSALPVQIFLVSVQASIVGLHFAFWSILPDTVEYGQRQTGMRSEAMLYGLSALFQRIAIGIGTFVVGLGLGVDGLHHAEAGDSSYRLVLAIIPFGFFALAGLLMLFNPLKQGGHKQILQDIRAA